MLLWAEIMYCLYMIVLSGIMKWIMGWHSWRSVQPILSLFNWFASEIIATTYPTFQESNNIPHIKTFSYPAVMSTCRRFDGNLRHNFVLTAVIDSSSLRRLHLATWPSAIFHIDATAFTTGDKICIHAELVKLIRLDTISLTVLGKAEKPWPARLLFFRRCRRWCKWRNCQKQQHRDDK